MKMIFNQIESILRKCDTPQTIMPPTHFYNEGWMLKLVLDQFASSSPDRDPHPLDIPKGCRWFSEALLPTAFKKKTLRDSKAETWTHADGVIGHFEVGAKAKTDLRLKKEATHFVVIEAKMFSNLSQRVTNAPYFNQAARIVACMAEVLKQSGRKAEAFKSLGFIVLAPDKQIQKKIFDKYLDKQKHYTEPSPKAVSLPDIVECRLEDYTKQLQDLKQKEELVQWYSDCFKPLLSRLEIQVISWEDVLGTLKKRAISVEHLEEFYLRCLDYNQKKKENPS